MIRSLMIIGLCSILALEAVLPGVDLAEISQLPELISHFRAHRKQSPDISFAEFLTLHYTDSRHLESTPADHQHLPFSKRRAYRIFLQFAQEPIVINAASICLGIAKIEGTNHPLVVPRIDGSPIWQPPRA